MAGFTCTYTRRSLLGGIIIKSHQPRRVLRKWRTASVLSIDTGTLSGSSTWRCPFNFLIIQCHSNLLIGKLPDFLEGIPRHYTEVRGQDVAAAIHRALCLTDKRSGSSRRAPNIALIFADKVCSAK